jgi:hypothetical protein
VNEFRVDQNAAGNYAFLNEHTPRKESFASISDSAVRSLENDESEDFSEKLKEYPSKETGLSRSSRGLRVLSVRVRELVFEKQTTTYKEVADELIQELLKKGKMAHDKYNVSA